MRVILLSDLAQVGTRGDVIQAKPGYARNYLIPKGLAVQATPANESWFEHQKKKIEQLNRQERDAASQVAARLDGQKIEIAKRVSESGTLYGSVTATDVLEALEAKGFELERRQVDLQGGIKEIGDFEVRILLHGEVTAVVNLTVVPEE